jgi:hypothetical protein
MLAAAWRRARGSAAFGRRRPKAFAAAFDLIVAPGDPFSHMTASRGSAPGAWGRGLASSRRGNLVLRASTELGTAARTPRRRIRHAEGVLFVEEAWFTLGVRDLWHARYRYRDERRDGSVRVQAAAFLARAWNPRTVRATFASCGLEIVRLWGGFDRRRFLSDASRLIITARRTSERR